MSGHAGATAGEWTPFEIMDHLEVNDLTVKQLAKLTGLTPGCVSDRDRTRRRISRDERDRWHAAGLDYNHIAAARNATEVDRVLLEEDDRG
jgi:hypothetical protein